MHVPGSGDVLLPHRPQSASAARALLRQELDGAAVDPELVADVVLVLSELINNAVLHARPLELGDIRVGWQIAPKAIRLSITDGGGQSLPAPRRPGVVTGRGLQIVAQMAREWGVERSTDASTVWAVVAR